MTEEKKEGITAEDVEVLHGEITPEQMRMVVECFDRLARAYPDCIDKVNIIFYKEGAFTAWGSAGIDVRVMQTKANINAKALADKEVFYDLAAHQFGHLVMSKICEDFAKSHEGLEYSQTWEGRMWDLFLRIEKEEAAGSEVMDVFLYKKYAKPNNIGYAPHPSVSNHSELFAEAFAMANNHFADFEKNVQLLDKNGKDLVAEMMTFLPKITPLS